MLARRGVEYRAQFGIDRNQKLFAGLALLDVQDRPVGRLADVLPPHTDDIASPLRRVEQKRHRQPRLRTDRMMRLVLLDLRIGPAMESVAFDRPQLDVAGRIGAHVATLERKRAE